MRPARTTADYTLARARQILRHGLCSCATTPEPQQAPAPLPVREIGPEPVRAQPASVIESR
ncbi:hypothetical protein [Rhizohabitans arisaemae]|uniref:hypothetical protein n=1 Tax=Rhizohabitans arisaemae TaxID=2720610 RepID=UPI0024B0E569|nr:hypothetical protein [Rhizohabitans arisaemae]